MATSEAGLLLQTIRRELIAADDPFFNCPSARFCAAQILVPRLHNIIDLQGGEIAELKVENSLLRRQLRESRGNARDQKAE